MDRRLSKSSLRYNNIKVAKTHFIKTMAQLYSLTEAERTVCCQNNVSENVANGSPGKDIDKVEARWIVCGCQEGHFFSTRVTGGEMCLSILNR